jgi:hypothetical protein
MVQRVQIDDGTLLVTADSKDAARRQAFSLNRDFKRSMRLRVALEITPGVFALGSEAVAVAKGEKKMPKRKWKKR